MLAIMRSLRRHGVWKAAGVYLLLSALFVSAGYGVVSVLGLSVLYARFVAVLAALGFPLALVLAWALGATPEQGGRPRVGAPHADDDAVRPVRAT